MPLTGHHMHYFTIQQREALQHQLEARAAVLREELDEDVKADLNAEPEAVELELDVAELRAVETALARLHEPEFGLCVDCDAEIPYARLSANPIATRCVICQAKHEQGKKPAPEL
jgi:RNA polymerase-binding transcription factor DksA